MINLPPDPLEQLPEDQSDRQPLDYQRKQNVQPVASLGWQLLVGASCWLVGIVGVVAGTLTFGKNGFLIGLFILIVVISVIGGLLSSRRAWQYFAAGVFIGVGLTILIGVGWCGMALQHI